MPLRFPFLLFLFAQLIPSVANSQVVTFFDDSSQEGYYDTGLAFISGNSTFIRTGPSGDKIPTVSNEVYRGDNALSLTWNSRPGGNWDALIIAPGFPFLDISQSDTLSFWVFAPQGLAKTDWPLLSMEGAPGNTKSLQYPLSTWADAVPVGTWVRIAVPLDVFFDDPNQSSIQFTQIKAIIFSQNMADQASHTLLIDELKAVPAGSGVPDAPTGFTAKGYERHGFFTWNPVISPSLDGYHLYRSSDQGQSFQLQTYFPAGDSVGLDFWGDPGTGLNFQYQLRAVNFVGQESSPSLTLNVEGKEMTDDEFMDMVQEATFRYFWDFAHPVSGLARERNSSGNTVTMGGSGFGIMALLVGIERGYITREQGRDRLLLITEFLGDADRFHGAWPHWMNGVTGEVIPFSAQDNGGDLVESAFLVQGLLAARSYFDQAAPEEDLLRTRITDLWESVEWNWYRRLNQSVLYWHWSPNFAWAMNFPLRGFNEAHIVYLLAIASPSHSVPASLYATGWAGSNYVSNQTHYGFPLDLGPVKGGPLFFAHYSYLGFDPRNKRDDYTNYFVRNAHHTLINRAWCIDNPLEHPGYGENSWGLTASDNPFGYLAHEPTIGRDNGTITPTAAIGSIPYTPELSIAALKHFYREHEEKLWGPMGFYDAFNVRENWYADSYLAIDQGPIILMIENYRSGLLWDLFMSNPEIGPALNSIGFVEDTSTWITSIDKGDLVPWAIFPNPVLGQRFYVEGPSMGAERLSCTLYSVDGRAVHFSSFTFADGKQEIQLPKLPYGTYYLQIANSKQVIHSDILSLTP